MLIYYDNSHIAKGFLIHGEVMSTNHMDKNTNYAFLVKATVFEPVRV